MKYRILVIIVLLGIAQLCLSQPQWEDVSPLPGHDIAFLTRMITPEGGLWAAICPIDSGVCRNDRHYRPFLSTDGGDSWEMRGTGIPEGIGVLRVEINPQNRDHLLASVAGWGATPYVSTDRGLTWAPSGAGLPNNPTNLQTDCDAGWFPDGAHAWCFIRWYFYDIRELFISSDSGGSWDSVWVEGGGRDFVTAVTPLFISNGLLWDHWPGICTSFDFGQSVVYGTTHLPRTEFRYLSGAGEGQRIVYGICVYVSSVGYNTYPCPIMTSDSGQTWQYLNAADTLRWASPDARMLVDETHSGHLFFSRMDSLFESWDNGLSWNLLIGDYPRYLFTQIGYDPLNDRIFASGCYPEPVTIFERGIWRLNRGQSVEPPARSTPQSIAVNVSPNPFNSSTQISFSLPVTSRVTLRLYDVLGREVKLLMDEMQTAGEHRVSFDGSDLSTGVYLCRMQAGERALTRKVVLVR